MEAELVIHTDSDTLQKAEAYAEKQGKTLESIVKDYIETLSVEDKKAKKTYSPLVESLRGALKTEDFDVENFDYKKFMEEEHTKDYWAIK